MPRSRNIGCSKIEYIKNIIIVVLLLTAVLLLYFFWRDTNLRKMGDQDELRKSYLESYYKPTIQEIVKPDEINIGFGESDYRKIGPQKFELIWAGSGEKDKNESIIAKLKAFGNKGDIIVNEINGQILSSCICVIIPNLTRNIRPYALIENVVTNEEHRRKGYATACLQYAKEIAIENNCYKIMLLTGAKNESTLFFYKNAGYSDEDKTAFIQWIE